MPRPLLRLLRLLGAVAVALAALVAVAGPASAHAELLSSSPADGATLDRAPARLVLRFTEPVEIDRTSVVLRTGAGAVLRVGRPVLRGQAPGSSADAVTVDVRLPALPRDTYRLEWRTLSSDDLHETYGTVVFGIGTPVVAAASGSASLGLSGLLEALARWVGFAGTASVLGGLALMTGLRRNGARLLLARLTRIMNVGSVASLSAVVVNGGLAAARAHSWVAGGALGWRWVLQLVASVLLVVATAALRGQRSARQAMRPGGPRRVRPAGVVAAVAGCGVAAAALAGHGPAADGVRGSLLVGLHLVSTATWTGGVVLLAVIAAARRRARVAGDVLTDEESRGLLRGFAPVAAPALVVSVATGLFLAGVLVPSQAALTETGYGRTLLVKVGLVLLAVFLGGATTRLVRRPLPSRRWARRLVGVEAAVLLIVLGGAALLTAQSPPTSLRWAADAPRASHSVHTRTVTDLVISATVAPNRPGPNFLTVSVLDTRRPAPAPVTGVDIVVTRPGVRSVLTTKPGQHSSWTVATDVLDRSGPWRLRVVTHRDGLPDARTAFRWVLVPAAGTEQGGSPLAAWFDQSAWLVLGLGLVLGGEALRRHRRSRSDADTSPVSASDHLPEPVGAGHR